jgi:hypothetical protein
MKTMIILFLGIIVLLSGCTTKTRTNYIIFLDNSTSVSDKTLEHYITIIQKSVLPNFGTEDKLSVEFIDNCTLSKSERIYTLDLAKLDFHKNSDGMNNEDDSIISRKRLFIQDSIEPAIVRIIMEKRSERKNCSKFTDIVNAFNEAALMLTNIKSYDNSTEKILNEAEGKDNYKYKNCIIMFSDMVNENPEKTLDFTQMQKLTEKEIDKRIEDLKDKGMIPNLSGTDVFIYGATSTRESGKLANVQIERIKLFWEQFLNSSSANLKAYGYDTEREIKEYLITEN